MKEGPDIALLGALIGDPARSNMLVALISGKALTASELAAEAGITLQTTSAHLGKLETASLIRRRKQGRHHYFTLADDDVASVLEAMMGLAAKQGHLRTRTGPRDPALRKARICYNHLAGEFGVHMYDSLQAQQYIVEEAEALELTERGHDFIASLGVNIQAIASPRRPLCRSCLDWSARRTHLAGSLGTALLDRLFDLNWAKRIKNTRIIEFSAHGERQFLEKFPI